jgi:hypothetical protein
MDNTARLADQFHNIAMMHSFQIVNQRMEFAWNEADPQMIQETYEVWNDLISDVVKFVSAERV